MEPYRLSDCASRASSAAVKIFDRYSAIPSTDAIRAGSVNRPSFFSMVSLSSPADCRKEAVVR